MSFLLNIFRFCLCRPQIEPQHQSQPQTQTRPHTSPAAPAPVKRPTAQSTPREPPRTRHVSTTLSPRTLAAFPRNKDFSEGGDARPALHTFRAVWRDGKHNASPEEDVGVEYVYPGQGKTTWPLRKVRVDGKPVASESGSGSERDGGSEDVDERGGEEGEEEEQGESITADLHEIDESTTSPPTGSTGEADKHDSPMKPSSPTHTAPKKMRVKMRKANDEDKGKEKYKVRRTTKKELE
jgi:hypothetical protein